MAEYDLDPAFEQRLEQVLRIYANEGVRTYDAVETTQFAVHGLPSSTKRARRPRLPIWVRPALVAALLLISVAAVGVASGIIKLPTNHLLPNPSFQPFSPPPSTFEPSAAPGSAQPSDIPAASQSPGTVPGSFPASAAPPTAALETAAPTLETPAASNSPAPSLDSTLAPTLDPTLEPTIEPTTEPTAAPVDAVDQGDEHACALVEERAIYCWGANEYGELGDGTRDTRHTPNVPVTDIDDAISVATGIRFSCAVRSDGTAWCWGEDPGSDGFDTSPKQVPGVSDAVEVTAGGAFACVLRRGGAVACWGVGQIGQLGNGEYDNTSGVPNAQAVVGIDDAVQISAGWNHACAVLSDRTLRCWGGSGNGSSGFGALGDGTFSNSNVPVPVVGIDAAVTVAAGGWSTCALVADGSVWCWGYGEQGGLGNGERANSNVPVEVLRITDARGIAVGRFHACAQRAAGVVSCWGDIGWGGGSSTVIPVDGSANVASVQIATDRSLLLVDQLDRLRQWGLGNDDGPEFVDVGP